MQRHLSTVKVKVENRGTRHVIQVPLELGSLVRDGSTVTSSREEASYATILIDYSAMNQRRVGGRGCNGCLLFVSRRDGAAERVPAHHLVAGPAARGGEGAHAHAGVRRLRHPGAGHLVDTRHGAGEPVEPALPGPRRRQQIER